MKRLLPNIPLILCPIILFLTVSILKDAHGPYYLWKFDHAYAYLVQSLNVAQFDAAGVQHPGTPLQLIGAVILRGSHLLSNTEVNFVSHVLTNPESYLQIFQKVLLLFQSFTLLWLGFYTFRISGNLLQSIFLQLSLFMSFWIYYLSFIIAAEQIVTITSLVMIGACIFYLYKIDLEKIPLKFLLSLSILCAIGLSSKLNFLPVLVIPFLILKGIRNKLYFSLLSLALFFILLLPVMSNFGQLVELVRKIMIYDGTLGSGNPDIVNFNTFFDNIILIFYEDLFFCLTYISTAAVLILTIFRKPEHENLFFVKARRLLFGIFMAFNIQLILVAKHYSPYYMVPAVLLSNLSIVTGILVLNNLFHFKKETLRAIYSFLMIIVCCYSIHLYSMWHEILIWNREEAIKAENYIRHHLSNEIVIPVYGSASSNASVAFSTQYGGIKRDNYRKVLDSSLNNKIFFSPFTFDFYSICDDKQIESIFKSKDKLFFEVRGEDILNKFIKGLEKFGNINVKSCKEIYHNDNEERVYEVTYELKN